MESEGSAKKKRDLHPAMLYLGSEILRTSTGGPQNAGDMTACREQDLFPSPHLGAEHEEGMGALSKRLQSSDSPMEQRMDKPGVRSWEKQGKRRERERREEGGRGEGSGASAHSHVDSLRHWGLRFVSLGRLMNFSVGRSP